MAQRGIWAIFAPIPIIIAIAYHLLTASTMSGGNLQEIKIEAQDSLFGVPSLLLNSGGSAAKLYNLGGSIFLNNMGSPANFRVEMPFTVGNPSSPVGVDIFGQLRLNGGMGFGTIGLSPVAEDLTDVTNGLNGVISVLKLLKIVF